MTKPTLYVLPGCPHCAKVESTLEELEVDYETIEVSPAHADRDEVHEVSGQRRVPVLVDEAHGVEGMPESDDIVDYLERTYGKEAEA